jgi:hypothetical protein
VGERPPRAARIALQSYISRLRRLVVPDSERLVPRHPRGYSLDHAVVDMALSTCSVWRASEIIQCVVEEGRSVLSGGFRLRWSAR